ncbi:MAG TPA: glutamate-cysteine ligase family protein [Pyrinomonadaceae bacterium]|jgi:glutamate--cysteine ligase|nr:glutamate-cysteine ligase family protein [Pyrinomonadaceae bacterium]
MTTFADQRLTKESVPLLADYLRRGAKPPGDWKCGLEIEFLGYQKKDFARLNARQVRRVLARLAAADRLYYEDDLLVELCLEGLGHVSVEPGGQIEFSGRERSTIKAAESDLRVFVNRLNAAAAEQGLIFLTLGYDPLRTIGEQHWYPKRRYDLMRPYLAARGARAWDMMTRTCAVQVNLDYLDEDDLVRKFILGNRLAPIVTAMFARSPFEQGRPSGYKSTRAAAWLQTDDVRCGLAPLALRDSFSLEDFVDYTLRVPMIFTRRGQTYSGANLNRSFGDYLATSDNNEPPPVGGDWIDHLTTIFTDARIKRYLEVRSVDCQPVTFALAAVALWKGLFDDRAALQEALRLAPQLGVAEAARLRESVARDGLAARAEGIDVLAAAKQIIRLADEALSRIAPDERRYLDPLKELIIEDELCPADVLLRNWSGSWHNSMTKVFNYAATDSTAG